MTSLIILYILILSTGKEAWEGMAKPSGRCPYCYGLMEVERFGCKSCNITVEGAFQMPRLLRLKPDQLEFVERFVLASGSLKEAAQELGVSYPTVRNRLDQIIETLQGKIASEQERMAEVMDALEEGKITADEAAELIKGAR